MQCVGCGSAAVTQRPERTAQGYRRFRCRGCGKQFNERSAGLLNRAQYPSDVITLVVLGRLRYPAFLTRRRRAEWRLPESEAGSDTYREPALRSRTDSVFF